MDWCCRAAVQSIYDARRNRDMLGSRSIHSKDSTCVLQRNESKKKKKDITPDELLAKHPA